MNNVTIVDYHLGNLFSLRRALEHLGVKPTITSDPKELLQAKRLILPGVGAFGEGMNRIREAHMLEAIAQAAAQDIPLLGICLGMQLLMTTSEELGLHQGMDLIKGDVTKLKDHWHEDFHFKIPHIGWNKIEGANGQRQWNDPLMAGITQGEYFYFVHSFGVFPASQDHALGRTQYGQNEFCSIVKTRKIYGCQFHPEMSGEAGLRLLNNFVHLS